MSEDAAQKKSNNLCQSIEDKDIYKYVLDTRNFEISLFWQRSNYFLVLNSALAVGFFSLKSTKFMYLLAALGFLSSFLWYLVMLGSKYWQSRWEHKLQLVESAIAPELKLFAADRSTLDKDVEESLKFNDHKGFQQWLDKQILKKPSVSYCMTMLAFIFMIGWLIVASFALLLPTAGMSLEKTETPTVSSTTNPTNAACTSQTAPPQPLSAQTENPSININVNVNGKAEPSSPPKTSKPNNAVKRDCSKATLLPSPLP